MSENREQPPINPEKLENARRFGIDPNLPDEEFQKQLTESQIRAAEKERDEQNEGEAEFSKINPLNWPEEERVRFRERVNGKTDISELEKTQRAVMAGLQSAEVLHKFIKSLNPADEPQSVSREEKIRQMEDVCVSQPLTLLPTQINSEFLRRISRLPRLRNWYSLKWPAAGGKRARPR